MSLNPSGTYVSIVSSNFSLNDLVSSCSCKFNVSSVLVLFSVVSITFLFASTNSALCSADRSPPFCCILEYFSIIFWLSFISTFCSLNNFFWSSISVCVNIETSPNLLTCATMFWVLNWLIVSSDCLAFSVLSCKNLFKSLLYLPKSTPILLTSLSTFSNPSLNLSIGPADKSSVISATIVCILGTTVLEAAFSDTLTCENIAWPIPDTISATSFLPPLKLNLVSGNAIIFYFLVLMLLVYQHINQKTQLQHQQ